MNRNEPYVRAIRIVSTFPQCPGVFFACFCEILPINYGPVTYPGEIIYPGENWEIFGIVLEEVSFVYELLRFPL